MKGGRRRGAWGGGAGMWKCRAVGGSPGARPQASSHTLGPTRAEGPIRPSQKVPGMETPWRSPTAEFYTLHPQDAYDISQLRHPTGALGTPLGRPLLRRDAPFGQARPPPPRLLPTSPADIADFINDVGAWGSGPHTRACMHTHIHMHTLVPVCTPCSPCTPARAPIPVGELSAGSGLTAGDPGGASGKLLRTQFLSGAGAGHRQESEERGGWQPPAWGHAGPG